MTEDFGFLSWKNNFAWTEKESVKTRAQYKRENANFKEALSKFSKGDIKADTFKHSTFMIDHIKDICWKVYPDLWVTLDIKGDYLWSWIVSGKPSQWINCTVMDTTSNGKCVAYTVESKQKGGDYRFVIASKSRTITGTIPIGPSIAIRHGRLYCMEATAPLQYRRLISVSLETGRDMQVHYEETNPAVSIDIENGENNSLFLSGYNSGVESLFLIYKGQVTRLDEQAAAFYSVGYDNGPIYFVRETFSSPWVLKGARLKLNSAICEQGIEYFSLVEKFLITKNFGIRVGWKLSENLEPRKLFEIVGDVILPPCSINNSPLTLYMNVPGMTAIKVCIDGTAKFFEPRIQYADLRVGHSKSFDGLPVRWALLQRSFSVAAKGLLLVAYGSYGLSLPLETSRWRVWLEAGWAVALLFIRGGGDGNEMWEEIGRREGKIGSVNDADACCVDLQKITGCGPKQTCIFGRSAGGLIVGNMAARYPNGERVGIIYAEVPYVDVLKTASNPDLPLTQYEYREFADPRRSPYHFEQALRISPIHQLGPTGAPGIKVLCRTGLKDMQVFPYESLKWILTLRGRRKGVDSKLLHIGHDGHSSSKEIIGGEHAEDFLIINNWI